MEETPRSLVENFIQNAQTLKTDILRHKKHTIPRTPESQSRPLHRVNTRSSKKSRLEDKTPRSMIESYITSMKTDIASRTKRRRSLKLPAVQEVNNMNTFTPRTNIAMMLEQAPEETPFIRPQTRRSSRKSLPAMPASDSVELLQMSESIEEDQSSSTSLRRSKRLSVHPSPATDRSVKKTPRRKSSIAAFAVPIIPNESIHLLPDTSLDEIGERDFQESSLVATRPRADLPHNPIFDFKDGLPVNTHKHLEETEEGGENEDVDGTGIDEDGGHHDNVLDTEPIIPSVEDQSEEVIQDQQPDTVDMERIDKEDGHPDGVYSEKNVSNVDDQPDEEILDSQLEYENVEGIDKEIGDGEHREIILNTEKEISEVQDQQDEEELDEAEEVTEDVTEHYRLPKTPHLSTPSVRPPLKAVTDPFKRQQSSLLEQKKDKLSKKIPKKTRSKLKTPLPASVMMNAFKHFSKMKVSKDVLPELSNVTEKFFKQMTGDLEAFCHHAGRKTIDETDVELLMTRQRLINKNTSLTVLVEEYLPLEDREQLIPIARSGNIVFP